MDSIEASFRRALRARALERKLPEELLPILDQMVPDFLTVVRHSGLAHAGHLQIVPVADPTVDFWGFGITVPLDQSGRSMTFLMGCISDLPHLRVGSSGLLQAATAPAGPDEYFGWGRRKPTHPQSRLQALQWLVEAINWVLAPDLADLEAIETTE